MMNTIIYEIYYVKEAAKETLPEGKHITFLQAKVNQGNSECRVIQNDSGINLGYYEITDRLGILFHHKVGAGVGSTISTRLAAGRSPSRRKAKKC